MYKFKTIIQGQKMSPHLKIIFSLLYCFFLVLITPYNIVLASTDYEEAKIKAEKTRTELWVRYQNEPSPIQQDLLLTDVGLKLQRLVVENLALP